MTVWVLTITFLLGPGEHLYEIKRDYETAEKCAAAEDKAKSNLAVVIIYIGCSEETRP